MIYLAHDGSVNGDWVSRYAIRMAAHTPDHALTVLHVADGRVHDGPIEAKLERLENECRAADVVCDIRRLALGDGVADTLFAEVEAGPEHFLVCGARVRSRDRGYLSGTVSSALLRRGHCNVLAIRVLHPGLLGAPRSILVPIGGSRAGLESGIAFLELLVPMVERIELVRVIEVGSFRFRRMSPDRARLLRRDGISELHGAESLLAERIGMDRRQIDVTAVVSDDWSKEVVISASRHKSQLIMIEAARSDLRRRFIFGNRLEEILRDAPCDVGVYRGAAE